MTGEFVIGVDVGTGSARAGLFSLEGHLAASAVRDIRLWNPCTDFHEQSTEDIWRAVCECVREVLDVAAVKPSAVIGISFDATCSLAALDEADRPVTVSPSGEDGRNVIVWMDHRAIEQAARINADGHEVLKYVGGKISPEQQPPKLLWLKENLPDTWRRAAKFFDLADFLTYRATGVDVRSLCTTVCKWTYLGREGQWDRSFFERYGIEDLLDRRMIGEKVWPMGRLIGCLTTVSAVELGLTTGTRVAVGIIDAHAGGIGLLGLSEGDTSRPEDLEGRLALIGGTSSCHMAVSREPVFIPGIWGPYYSAMVPGMWLTEGGQSATGSLVDFVIRDSARFPEIKAAADSAGETVYQYLNGTVERIMAREGRGPEIVKDINVLPYFLGNRSPLADPSLRGVFSGLSLDDSEEAVARKYYATVQAIAFGTRHIIEDMNAHGYGIKRIHACGGGTKNPLWLQAHADITGCEIVLGREPEAVLLGAAVLAAVGAGSYGSIVEAAAAMSAPGKVYSPRVEHAGYYRAKYGVFRQMHRDFLSWRSALEGF